MALADGGWMVGDHLVKDIAAGLRTIGSTEGCGRTRRTGWTTSSQTCFRRWRFS
ncbi:hypothetical protein [Streptosporangium saharense]|uniref:hypothetical protein n=1 Tax=Streptosporangium saharense TaxID=1706840 RepID=UPI001FEBBA9A|nr:hypothetical protein [Streptosporangium saharense]